MDETDALIDDLRRYQKEDEAKLLALIMRSEVNDITAAVIKSADLSIFNNILKALRDEQPRLIELMTNVRKKVLNVSCAHFFLQFQVLPALKNDKLNMKFLGDVYSRCCIEIEYFSMNSIVQLGLLCETHIAVADSRSIFWKDLLPCCLRLIVSNEESIEIDGISKTGREYHQQIINGILSKPFNHKTLSSLVGMFREIEMDKKQMSTLLQKICDNLYKMEHSDLAAVSYELFNMTLFNQLVIPVLALDSYFNSNKYNAKFNELCSTNGIDSIDPIAEDGISQTEETICYHFSSITEYTNIQKDLVQSLKVTCMLVCWRSFTKIFSFLIVATRSHSQVHYIAIHFAHFGDCRKDIIASARKPPTVAIADPAASEGSSQEQRTSH